MDFGRKLLGTLWIAAAIAFTGWGWYTYTGVYRWFAEWQLQHFGEYGLKLTFLFPIIVLSIPGMLLRGDTWRRRAPSQVPMDPGRLKGTMMLFGLFFMAAGGGLGWNAAQGFKNWHPPTPTVLDLTTTSQAPSLGGPVIVVGILHPDLTTSFKTTYEASTGYIPLTDARPKQPLAYFLRTNRDVSMNMDHPGEEHSMVRGPAFRIKTEVSMIRANALPGPLKEVYRKHNIPLAETVYVVDEMAGNENPAEKFAIAAGLCGLVGFSSFMGGLLVRFRKA